MENTLTAFKYSNHAHRFCAFGFRNPIRINLLLFSLEGFFIVTEALMYFNCLACAYLGFNSDGQNSPDLILFSQVPHLFTVFAVYLT